MASTGSLRVLRRAGTEVFIHDDFIQAVPAGATDTGDIALPEGTYHIMFLGTQTAATTAPTIAFETYMDAAKTRSVPIGGGIYDDSAGALATTLDVAKGAFTGALAMNVSSMIGQDAAIVYVGPGGLKWTYTKNGGTAIRLTLVAVRI